jgi:DNA-binding NarL/FixJ family response regulator
MVSAKPEFPDAGNPDGGYEPDEGADNAAIRIVLADSQAIYRVGIRKIFALEDDIRVIAQVDTLAGLHSAIQRFPTDLILLEGNLIAGTVDAIPELVRRAPQLKIIVQSA